ncbi:MAG: hypothetical protein GXP47_08860 [Acidobacteria bacterium]|nr:hypothetical protein [Acidobacteriota bacterium]
MSESRTQWLHQLMKRLGEALHGGVVESEEVQRCLRELHEAGWDAVMLLEASVVCRHDGQPVSREASLHVHAEAAPSPEEPAYRLSHRDAAFLASLGISPSRHRSLPSPPAASPSPSHDDTADG